MHVVSANPSALTIVDRQLSVNLVQNVKICYNIRTFVPSYTDRSSPLSIALYTPSVDTVSEQAPSDKTSASLELVVDNTLPAPLTATEQNWKKRTAYTQILKFDAGREIDREDQMQVMQTLAKYAKVILSIIFKGTIIHYAVNLRQIDMTERRDYLANIRRDLAHTLPLTLSFDTGRQMTPERRRAVIEALQWAKHIVTSVSFSERTVSYAVTIGNVDEQHHKTVLMALEGDIFVAVRSEEWS